MIVPEPSCHNICNKQSGVVLLDLQPVIVLLLLLACCCSRTICRRITLRKRWWWGDDQKEPMRITYLLSIDIFLCMAYIPICMYVHDGDQNDRENPGRHPRRVPTSSNKHHHNHNNHNNHNNSAIVRVPPPLTVWHGDIELANHHWRPATPSPFTNINK